MTDNLRAAGLTFPRFNWLTRLLRGGCYYGDTPSIDAMFDQAGQMDIGVGKWVDPD